MRDEMTRFSTILVDKHIPVLKNTLFHLLEVVLGDILRDREVEPPRADDAFSADTWNTLLDFAHSSLGSVPCFQHEEVFAKGNDVPLHWHPPLLRLDEVSLFVAGEAEADEPLAVQRLRHLLQHCDPASGVLDQVIVGRQNARDLPLNGATWS